MSYSMSQMDSCFHMKNENLIKAKKALLSTGNFKGFRTFFDIMLETGWTFELDEDENVISIQDDSGYLRSDQNKLFDLIAPFVEKGSYIQMFGEDGSIWRWVFDGTECNEIYPTIIWDE